MQGEPGTVTRWLEDLRSGAPEKVALAQEEITRKYAASLRALVVRKLHRRVASLEPPSGVANSALNEFFAAGGTTEVPNRDSLWRLLAEIVVCKALNRNRHHFAQCRDLRRNEVLAGSGAPDKRVDMREVADIRGKRRYCRALKTENTVRDSDSGVNGDTLGLLTMDAQPEHAAMLKETLAALGKLEPVARLYLMGYGKYEIAKRLDLSPKTVRRNFEQIADTLSRQRKLM